jgi:hypothetical protein
MSKNAVEPIDAAIGRLQSAVRERTREGPQARSAQDVETDALLGAAARLRHACIAHAYEGCESCALMRHLGDQEVASLLLWDAVRDLQPAAMAMDDQQAMVQELLDQLPASGTRPSLH